MAVTCPLQLAQDSMCLITFRGPGWLSSHTCEASAGSSHTWGLSPAPSLFLHPIEHFPSDLHLPMVGLTQGAAPWYSEHPKCFPNFAWRKEWTNFLLTSESIVRTGESRMQNLSRLFFSPSIRSCQRPALTLPDWGPGPFSRDLRGQKSSWEVGRGGKRKRQLLRQRGDPVVSKIRKTWRSDLQGKS